MVLNLKKVVVNEEDLSIYFDEEEAIQMQLNARGSYNYGTR